jgi:hypothetical protein
MTKASGNPFNVAEFCGACGLCCDGVMFRMVILQSSDSARAFSALGLKLKRKNRQQYIPQPCPAYRDSQCNIYAERPARCRLFECRQFKQVTSGEITIDEALRKIREARQQVDQINLLLQQTGLWNAKKRLSSNVERCLAEPLDAPSDPAALQRHEEISQAMQTLNKLLNQDFRITPLDYS